MNEIKELNRWRDIPYSWIRRLNIVKTSDLPYLIYRFNAIPIKIASSCVVDIGKLILKFIKRGGKKQQPKNRIANPKLKKNKIKGLTLPNFKTYYKATAIKTECDQSKNRQIKGTESKSQK